MTNEQNLTLKESDLVDAKISIYEPEVELAQTVYHKQNGKYKQEKSLNNEPNIFVDEYTNNKDVLGYAIRSIVQEDGKDKVKIVDKGNGGFDTGGWKVDA